MEKGLLEAPRVHGDPEAVYYMLRGFGQPTCPNSGPIPRIEVWASEQPSLFRVLKRIGMAPSEGKIVLEPRPKSQTVERESAPNVNSMSSTADLQRLHSGTAMPAFMADVKSHPLRLGKPFGASLRQPRHFTEEDAQVLFERLNMPKCTQDRRHFVGAIEHAALGEASKQPSKVQKGGLKPYTGARDELPDEAGIGCWWGKPPERRMGVKEQRDFCQTLSQPKCAKHKAFARPRSGPTRFGLAAHRSLCQRIGNIRAAGGYGTISADPDPDMRPWVDLDPTVGLDPRSWTSQPEVSDAFEHSIDRTGGAIASGESGTRLLSQTEVPLPFRASSAIWQHCASGPNPSEVDGTTDTMQRLVVTEAGVQRIRRINSCP
mmetsp:Transcript_108963/g.307086  ORF Transcript_108963/g.307086 Transcript_108963/m.307086 type:complete len:375 (-) Transcript_108963:15-1139(-)|eukprot:CAMPEP_0117543102 /NCGR_PEP_ID=MMETSP0784-20121206/44886_1 /TAXON_ID=39447 /ORGANISM="" /LENGTH=374 /DNA_ID=CAMNT_0005339867 /DNA_START=63 /DNA_END=1183 /DNA_ORIENTATION=-